MSEKVIYENPAEPLPEWARALVLGQDQVVRAIETPTRATIAPFHWSGWISTGRVKFCPEYNIPGPWRDSLRRIIRLGEPAYYVPENPHTRACLCAPEAEGFLPHDGGPMPDWLTATTVIDIFCRSSRVHTDLYAMAWTWEHRNNPADIIAYRIVEDQGRQVPPHRSGGGFLPPDRTGEELRGADITTNNVINLLLGLGYRREAEQVSRLEGWQKTAEDLSQGCARLQGELAAERDRADMAEKFHRVAVSERDYERHRAGRAEAACAAKDRAIALLLGEPGIVGNAESERIVIKARSTDAGRDLPLIVVDNSVPHDEVHIHAADGIRRFKLGGDHGDK